jgi:pyruvate dehydrogenase E2 component (dihydrolipoamide acetyltransferase)
MSKTVAATPDLLPPTTPERAAPAAPPVSSRPLPPSAPPAPTAAAAPVPAPEPVAAPAPVYVPAPILAPPPVMAAEVEAHVHGAAPVAEPLFTIKVWQLGFAVIVVLALLLHFAGLI